MKANEMMYGDLVMYGGHLCRFEISASSAYLLRLSDGSQYLPIACNEAEHIQLTPEILEKNGFKFVGKIEWDDGIYVSRYRYRDKNLEKLFEINYTPDYDGFTWNGIEINDVHILQHALRLCGLNEKADNLKVEEE